MDLPACLTSSRPVEPHIAPAPFHPAGVPFPSGIPWERSEMVVIDQVADPDKKRHTWG